jgi:hypothetical protein
MYLVRGGDDFGQADGEKFGEIFANENGYEILAELVANLSPTRAASLCGDRIATSHLLVCW